MSSVLKLIHKPLSDLDLQHILGNDIKIIKYADLANYTDLDDLLPAPLDYCIILYENMPNSGHWTGLSKYNEMYEHLDSYGVMPDTELHWINPKMRESLHEKVPHRKRSLTSIILSNIRATNIV